jgi:putative transposase
LVYRIFSVFDTIVAIMAVNRKAFKLRLNPTTESKFKCVECGYTQNADSVGALNGLARGHRVIACGVETLVLTMKQEPLGSSDTRPILAA